MRIRVEQFRGEIPRINPRLLPDNYSQDSSKCDLSSGGVRPLSKDLNIIELRSIKNIEDFYRYNGNWYTFGSKVDIQKGPIKGDTKDRIFITGIDDYLRVTDIDTVTPDTFNTYKAGIPYPSAAPTVNVSSPSGTDTSRTYIYTYVREWGDGKVDEGPPFTASDVVDCNDGDTVELSDLLDCPDKADYNVSKIRIYRSNITSEGTGVFLYVDEISSDEGTYIDTKEDADLGEELTTLDWIPPVEGIKGLISLPNGCLAGFKDNVVYFSYPYKPHAWPDAYSITVDFPIVGIESFGNYVAVMTTGFPSVILCDDPSAPARVGIESPYPCTSKDGIVAISTGVYYPSEEGLVFLNHTGGDVITRQIYSIQDWKDLGPDSIKAALFEGKYVFFHSKTWDAFTKADTAITIDGGVVLDVSGDVPYIVSLGKYFNRIWYDVSNNELFYIGSVDGVHGIYKHKGDLNFNDTFTWKSKEFKVPRVNLSVGRILADFARISEISENIESYFDYIEEFSGRNREQLMTTAIGFNRVNEIPIAGDYSAYIVAYYNAGSKGVHLKVYADKKLVLEKNITNSNIFKLPAGYVADYYEFEISSNIEVTQVDLATSSMELVNE